MSGQLRQAVFTQVADGTGAAASTRLRTEFGAAYRILHVFVDDSAAAGTGNVVLTDELGNNLGVTDFTVTGTNLWTTDDLGGQHAGVIVKSLTVTLDSWTEADAVTTTVIYKDE